MKVDLKQLQNVILELEKDYCKYIINTSNDGDYKPISADDKMAALAFADLLQDLEECFLQFGEIYSGDLDKMDKLTKYYISSSYVQTMRWFASFLLRELDNTDDEGEQFHGYNYLYWAYKELDKCCPSRERRI